MIDRLISSLVALSLAFLVWLYARSRDQETLDNIPIPVQIALAPGQADHYDLEVDGPAQVPVSFAGPPSRLRELRGILQRGGLRVEVTLEVPEDRQNESHYLDTVHVEASDLQVPPGVTAVVADGHNRIPVTLHRLVERRLPVRLDQSGDDRLGQVTLEPATALVRGPQEVLERARSLPTQPYAPPPTDAVPGQETVARGFVPLVRELEGRPIRTTPGRVLVCLTLKPKQKVYELADVPVRFLCPANFPLRPQFVDERAGKVSLRVLGPAAEAAPAVTAFVDLTAGKFEPGFYADEPLRLQLPKDFQLAQDPPRLAAFKLVSGEAAGKGGEAVDGP
jgi:hypothetical protein